MGLLERPVSIATGVKGGQDRCASYKERCGQNPNKRGAYCADSRSDRAAGRSIVS